MTHARMLQIYIQLDKIEAAITLFTNEVLPLTRRQPGFQGARVLVNRETGKGVIVTLWASIAEMQATETSGYLREQLAKFPDLFSAPPVRETYELVISV